ncbi:hypothetical protein NEIRO03_0744 [Nematocida sp. AWRm78]|nr:hypothetical protein NEIRO02_1025 [Nematocida sp. AWRm79]KAI5183122.1 hypothetical protein NEIRO03_0744 [Nematocida sp. AWRm78]
MQEEQEMGNTELGVSEGVDRILSSGSMCAYKKGVVLGYFDSLSINMNNLTGKTVKLSLSEMERVDRSIFQEIFKKKNLLEW